MSASCRRCRGSRANCRIPRLAVPANVLFRGLSGYLLPTCLLKRVFCCVRVSNHVPYRRVASLASDAAGRGADADVGWLCRLQRRYADAPFRQLPFPIPLPRSPKRPVRCGRPPSSAASCRNMRGRRRNLRNTSPSRCRRPRSLRRTLIRPAQAACREEGAGFRPMRRRPVRRLKPRLRCRRARSRPPVRPRRAAPRSSSAPAIRSTSWRSATMSRVPRSCRPMATRARARCRPVSN